MSDYRHYVSGFFPHKTDAESVLAKLVERELPRERLYIFDADSAPAIPASPANSKEVLGDVLVDSAIGTVVGTGLGALAEVVLIAANVSLFVASPLLAPLMMLGWGGDGRRTSWRSCRCRGYQARLAFGFDTRCHCQWSGGIGG